MARKLSSRERNLLIVLGIVALVVLWRVAGSDGARPAGSGTGEDGEEFGLGEPPVVSMALLARLAEGYDPEGRDLFKYGKKPPPPPDPKVLEAKRKADDARRQAAAAAAAKRKNTPPPAPRGPVPPKINFTYVGYFGPKDDKIAVFEEKDEVLIARRGETLLDDFRVVEIQYESVVIGFTDPRFEKKTETLGSTKGSKPGRPGRRRR